MAPSRNWLSYLWLLCVPFAAARVAMPPTVDPFYQPPAGFESQATGTILRARTLENPPDIDTTIAATYQLLYRSSDSQNRPTAVVTTLLVPPNGNPNMLFSLQCAYDSVDPDCPTSYTLYQPDATLYERDLIATLLSSGYYVAMPDYEGFTASFVNGLQCGKAVLDSINALLASGTLTGISPSARVLLGGSSGGAQATGWALELQEEYAPSTPIAGAIIGSLLPNLTAIVQTVDSSLLAGVLPLGFLGLAKQYSEFSNWLSNTLVPSNAEAFLGAEGECGVPFVVGFGYQNVVKNFLGGAQNVYGNPIFQSVMRTAGQMGLHGTPKVPLFMAEGLQDQLSPIDNTDRLINEYCADGASIIYYRINNADHGNAAGIGFNLGMSWIQGIMQGTQKQSGCVTHEVTYNSFTKTVSNSSSGGVSLSPISFNFTFSPI